MDEIFQVFLEESQEGLAFLESSLLALRPDVDIDNETINAMFRAAHSIKGGSGTLGLGAISEFTHSLEAVLDQLRNHQQKFSPRVLEGLLQGVDAVRGLFEAALQGDYGLNDHAQAVQARLTALLVSNEIESEVDSALGEEPNINWSFRIVSHPELLSAGHEPLKFFRTLKSLGAYRVRADIASLPGLSEIDPLRSFLSWQVSMAGEVTRDQVEAVFTDCADFVELDFSGLSIDRLVSATPGAGHEASFAADLPAAGVDDNEEQAKEKPLRKNSIANASIRVATEKIDKLVNLVGELVITQSMLVSLSDGLTPDQRDKISEGLEQLSRNTRELQENALRIRMQPINVVFSRFPRLIHDLSRSLGKQVDLRITGESTELDKTMLEKLGDPMVHLIRNSLDHGLELPEVRAAAGKPETGTLSLTAYHEGSSIVIEVRDDGGGINTERVRTKAIQNGLISEDDDLSDQQINNLIFSAGFSTADEVTDVSGRGVGMDVVKRNMTELGGAVTVSSQPGHGTMFSIRLPLTLAILDGQLVRVGRQVFTVPLASIVESVQMESERVFALPGSGDVYKIRDLVVPIARFCELFNIEPDNTDRRNGLLVIAEYDGDYVGLIVDELLGQQQVVVKNLEDNFHPVDGISGATILGDGTISLILDVTSFVKQTHNAIAPAVSVAA